MVYCPKDGSKLEETLTGPRTPFPEDVLSEEILGGHRDIRKIAFSVMGPVFRATRVADLDEVMIRVFPEEMLAIGSTAEQIEAEFHTRGFPYPDQERCVPLLDVVPDGRGGVQVVTEWIQGKSLEDVVFQVGALPVPLALAILRQIVLALAEIHSQGTFHGSLNPRNIFLLQDGRPNQYVRILDMALAEIVQCPRSNVLGESVGRWAWQGDPCFLSPEQKAGLPADSLSDVYSLSLTILFMLGGRHPLESEPSGSFDLSRDPSELLSRYEYVGLPPGLSAALTEGLRFDRSRRIKSVKVLRRKVITSIYRNRRRFQGVVTISTLFLALWIYAFFQFESRDEKVTSSRGKEDLSGVRNPYFEGEAPAWYGSMVENIRRQNYQQVPNRSSMVFISGGRFIVGNAKGGVISPITEKRVSSFYIDSTEVSCSQYARFLVMTGHRKPRHWKLSTPPEGTASDPVTGINYFDAKLYALWAGKDLPTEWEWEFAARGSEGRIWPWGNRFDRHRAVLLTDRMQSVGSREQVSGNIALYDMAGNVWEWTSSIFPMGESEGKATWFRVIRGGGFRSDAFESRAWYRDGLYQRAQKDDVGFRCVVREK
jgi:formylglycine-generating enzyme required for sulfatase activity